MSRTKYEELQNAIYEYGHAAFQNLMRCRALATALVEALPAYLQCGPECVHAVPYEGAFDPRKNYGDEAFSYHHREVIILEPVRFGIALIVGNAEDSGSLWLRTVISAEVTGDSFDIFIADRPIIRIPINFEGHLEPILEAIHKEFLESFTLEVLEFNDRSFKTGIGFLSD